MSSCYRQDFIWDMFVSNDTPKSMLNGRYYLGDKDVPYESKLTLKESGKIITLLCKRITETTAPDYHGAVNGYKAKYEVIDINGDTYNPKDFKIAYGGEWANTDNNTRFLDLINQTRDLAKLKNAYVSGKYSV